MFNNNRRLFIARLIAVSLIVTIVSVSAFVPDEGMYAPDQIAKLPLKKRGLKIKPSELYDPSAPSISDAVVRVNIATGGFGTGEFISPEGLILTNHHVGFDALVEASTKENDLAENGFSAASRAEEIPAKGYTLILTTRVEDVTARVLDGISGLSGDQKAKKISENMKSVEAAEQAKSAGASVRVSELNEGYFYYLYETQTIKDVRVVYAPPKSIGFFGGDPDNFEWTRHTGDFTFLRAYTAPDGRFAEYSADNVPFKPKRFLKISLDGLDDGDFVMVMGYPGSTTRFMESASIEYAQNINFPYVADYVRTWSATLTMIGEKYPDKALPLQAEIFSLNNTQKLYDGNVEAMRRARIVDQRRRQEQQLAQWINADPARRDRYAGLFEGFEKATSEYYKDGARTRALQIFPSFSSTKAFGAVYTAMSAVLNGDAALKDDEARKKREEGLKAAFEDWNSLLEFEMLQFFLKKIDELPPGQRFAYLDEALYEEKEGKERRLADQQFASLIIGTFNGPDKILPIYDMDRAELQAKYNKLSGLVAALQDAKAKIGERSAAFNREISPLRLQYRKALAEWQGGVAYPDANATLRFSFGNVRGYNPREAVTYHPFTTLSGVIEKDSGVDPFDAPEELEKLAAKGDFGRYGKKGSLPVNFLSDTDIIGGNSGSPVLNAKGEQVGIVFDGNYEGLGNNMFFNPSRGRTISVDIRYVLFLTEKMSKSGWILNEMSITGSKKR